MNSTMKNLMFWMVAALVIFLFWSVSSRIQKNERQLSFSDFMAQLDRGQRRQSDHYRHGCWKPDRRASSKTASRSVLSRRRRWRDLVNVMLDKGVEVHARDANSSSWLGHLISWTPYCDYDRLFDLFHEADARIRAIELCPSARARRSSASSQQKKVTFKDVAGVDEAKEELQEIIDFSARASESFKNSAAVSRRACFSWALPAPGKTLLARAISGEANVPFFSISGSDFVEMFVGVGASRVRDLFEQGKKNAPCIIFIDEIDAVGRHRGAGLGEAVMTSASRRLNQLLVEMDGFESNEGVILIAATNRPDVLDPALLRPGRFDRRVVVSLPDVGGREGILKVHTSRIPLANDVASHASLREGHRVFRVRISPI